MVSHSCRDVSAGTPLPSLITAPDNARAIEMANITYEIVESIAVLSESSKGWTKELNLISWNDRDPKYDIREWSPDHEKMGKGVTLSDEEVAILKKDASDFIQCRKLTHMARLSLFPHFPWPHPAVWGGRHANISVSARLLWFRHHSHSICQ